jgi:hypothetical protein
MGDRIRYVGLDVHKEGIVAAAAEDGAHGEIRELRSHCEHAERPGSSGRLVPAAAGQPRIKLSLRHALDAKDLFELRAHRQVESLARR